MKKVIVLLIGAIFVMSVVLISMFGMRMFSFNVIIYAEKVEFIGAGIFEGFVYDPDAGEKKLTQVLELDYTSGEETEYILSWQITPADTTHKDVTFSHSLNENDTRVEIDEWGVIKINAYISFVVYITVQDGSNTKGQLRIVMNKTAKQ